MPGLVHFILMKSPAYGDCIMPTLLMGELRSPSSRAVEAPPQVLGLTKGLPSPCVVSYP